MVALEVARVVGSNCMLTSQVGNELHDTGIRFENEAGEDWNSIEVPVQEKDEGGGPRGVVS